MTRIEKLQEQISQQSDRILQLEKDIVILNKSHEEMTGSLVQSHWAISVLCGKEIITKEEIDAYGSKSIRALAKEVREKGSVDSSVYQAVTGMQRVGS